MSLLRGFKLIQLNDDQIGLLPLGVQLVNTSDPSKQLEARRVALLNLKAYSELVSAFDGTELPASGVLAARLKFDYGKSDDFAGRAANAFVDSLKHAEMLDDQNVVRKEGVGSKPPGSAEEAAIDDDDAAAEIDRAFSDADPDDPQDGPDRLATDDPVGVPTGIAAIDLRLTLDLSRYRADEVVLILRALGLAGSG